MEWINLAKNKSKGRIFCEQDSKHVGCVEFGDIAWPEDDIVLTQGGICPIKLATAVIYTSGAYHVDEVQLNSRAIALARLS
jgi:hypothetical protein